MEYGAEFAGFFEDAANFNVERNTLVVFAIKFEDGVLAFFQSGRLFLEQFHAAATDTGQTDVYDLDRVAVERSLYSNWPALVAPLLF